MTGRSDLDPLWYKDAIIYQAHVRAFSDSSGDGIGDFSGLTQKLDYLQDLGVTAVWLLPFYPSPLRDDGYDIADYTSVHPAYGTLRDARAFVREAHRRGLKVITELVCNHTSDQHPWFQRARKARPGSAYRDFYVWSDTPERYRDARIIFKDFETSNWSWDPVAQAYYWHRFYSHQPDLNFENPRVQAAFLKIMEFWLDLGVDGFRLDAIPYLFEAEGTSCENLPETHAYLKRLRAHVDAHYPGRVLLGEANQWPEDAVAYFGDPPGDECNMSFHFPLMPRMFMALRMEDRYPVIDILNQTPALPELGQWAIFLRNHDELTLEMVTDEERDYMYRAYARDPQMRINLGIRRRLAPLLGNNRRRIELMNGLLFSLPGTPIIYYGDEIGMGDNVFLGDRNGVRTPMQWSSDRNAGFSSANRQRLYLPVIVDPEYHFEAVNVEAQSANPHSLLWWMKRLIALRKQHPAFSRGSLEIVPSDNRKVIAFVRSVESERILVVANLSRFVQAVELDLSAWNGSVPVELFGQTRFPTIGDERYFISLGPHSFFWFEIEPAKVVEAGAGELAETAVPALAVAGHWTGAASTPGSAVLREAVPRWLPGRPWFAGRGRAIRSVEVVDVVTVDRFDLVLLQVEYRDADPDSYLVPVSFRLDADGASSPEHPDSVIARLETSGGTGVLVEAVDDPDLGRALVNAFDRRRRVRGRHGLLVASTTRVFHGVRGSEPLPTSAQPRAGTGSTSLVFGDRLILKLLRKIEAGMHPDAEIGRALCEQGAFDGVAPFAGMLEYRPDQGEPSAVGVLHGYVRNEGDAWSYALDELGAYWERVAGSLVVDFEAPLPAPGMFGVAGEEPPQVVSDLIEPFRSAALLIGRRVGRLHLALSRIDDPSFTPESFSPFHQRETYQMLRGQASETLALLRGRLAELPERHRTLAERALVHEGDILQHLHQVVERRFDLVRTRTHGDLHLGHVLFTGTDFVIVDFEGDPARRLNARRSKRSPMRDVAAMLRSFDAAARLSLETALAHGVVREDRADAATSWVRLWRDWIARSFLAGYVDIAGQARFVPRDPADLATLLDVFVLSRGLSELRRDLGDRPEIAWIPLSAIVEQVESDAEVG